MQGHDHIRLAPVVQRARIEWSARAFILSYWNEASAEKETLLDGLMGALLPQKYFVVADTGWSKWDLKIARGLWSRALLTVCSENHGGGKRLLKVRCALRSSSLARVLLRSYAALAAGSLILGAPVAASICLAIGFANLGIIGWRLVTFGRIMQRIIEAVASQARLLPADPVAAATLPIGGPRTV
jgi:hypothetical protein